jgi:adenylate cyclase, class 2
MPVEIEAKMKVPDLAVIRERLKRLNATRVGSRLELNAFFDTPDRALKAQDQGLRLRTMTDEAGGVTCVATFKGPHVGERSDGERGDGDGTGGGELKRREEIEYGVEAFEPASAVFARLGYAQQLAFEKRRETWSMNGCLIELDELPYLGTFVEIEADSAEQIHAVRAALSMIQEPLITRGYIGMMSKLVKERPELGPIVRF